ncbi:hypothetical protein CDD83_5694 [Cordyceps sp. RAO-2017]|nr:hypothetical protein CDD83_5694 [Cordyceps sp. RAO-2017]
MVLAHSRQPGLLHVARTHADTRRDASAPDKKRGHILDACQRGNVSALRSLSDSPGGLLDDDLRQVAWPILLGLASSDTPMADSCRPAQVCSGLGGDWKLLPQHRDEGQVQLDVNRSFTFYPHNQSEAELEQRKAELSSLIVEVLRRYPFLCYFQGFHDICQVVLLVMDRGMRANVVARLCLLRIRDFMLPSLGPTTAQLRLLPDILAKADPELRCHIASIEPFYALAGTLTMYAHNIEDYHGIARLFDVFFAREPVFSIYIFARIVMNRRDEILNTDESDMLQVILSKVPGKMDLDVLVARRYNRPISAVCLAVAVAGVAYYLQSYLGALRLATSLNRREVSSIYTDQESA